VILLIFLGRSAWGGRNTGDATFTSINNINKITLKNGIYDDMYITQSTVETVSPLNRIWNYDSILHALFDGNLMAGNIEYSVSAMSSIRVKRRKKGEYNWTALFEVNVLDASSLSFEKFDKYASGGDTEYEYCLVPVMSNGIEGNINTNTVISSFDGIFISEKNQTFNTPLDVKISSTRNRQSSILNPLNGKYPVVIYNGQNNYYSGTTSGVFIEHDDDTCEWKIKGGVNYRLKLMDFLYDGNPKLFKVFDGRTFIISIVDNGSEDNSEHPDKAVTTFQWVEIGNPNDSQDLYSNGLTDTNVESW